jgi:hypothetical protein
MYIYIFLYIFICVHKFIRIYVWIFTHLRMPIKDHEISYQSFQVGKSLLTEICFEIN